jgi:hypothetical protein
MITALKDRLDLTADDLKAYLKIENEAENAQLEIVLAAAKLQADHFCQNNFEETSAPFPEDIKQAVLRIAAALYENRADHKASESVQGIGYQTGQIEWNAQRLLAPYRRFFAV